MRVFGFLIAGSLALAGSYGTQGATISFTSSAPAANVIASAPTANAAAPNGSNDYTDNYHAGIGIGQEFTVSSPTFVDAYSVLAPSNGTAGAAGGHTTIPFLVTFGTISGSTFTILDDESTQALPVATFTSLPGNYLTFTLDTPQAVTPGVNYGFILSTYFANTDYGYIGTAESTDPTSSTLTGFGTSAYSAGPPATVTDSTLAYNRVFYVQTPEPASCGVFGIVAVGLLIRRRRRQRPTA
jgi:hypothetical protein